MEPHGSILECLTDADPSWTRLRATADAVPTFSPEFLEQERRALGDHDFNREYLGIPGGGQASPFTWELYERATQVHLPLVPPGSNFRPRAQERGVPVVNPFQHRLAGVGHELQPR